MRIGGPRSTAHRRGTELVPRLIITLFWAMPVALTGACSPGKDIGGSTAATDGDADADSDSDVDEDTDTDENLPVDTSGVFVVDASISPVIGTVGIIEWSVDRAPLVAARIEFGLDTNYGKSAPVDLNQSGFRTLLLGMKPSSTYHFRIRAVFEDTLLVSGDYLLETRGLSTALTKVNVTTSAPSQLAGGYTISSFFSGAAGDGESTVFVLDRDGTYVWSYSFVALDFISRAKMSANGKYMLAGTLNVGDKGKGAIYTISMDGLEASGIRIPSRHHDFTILPDDTIAYIEFETGGLGKCDRIMERGPGGETRVVYTIRDDFSGLATIDEWCHSNAIHYSVSQDAYYLSVLNQDMVIKVNRTSGALEWILGGEMSDFEGAAWNRQHGNHALENGNILIFNNNAALGAFGIGSSLVLELALNQHTGQAAEVWRYDGDAASSTLGDVQRLPNGNTLVTYSNSGLMHEVNSAAQLVQSFAWASGSGLSYADRRMSLYGAPDHF